MSRAVSIVSKGIFLDRRSRKATGLRAHHLVVPGTLKGPTRAADQPSELRRDGGI